MLADRYTIKYYNDEVQVHQGKCLQPGNCDCLINPTNPKCCYTAEEAKSRLLQYYRQRVEYLEKLSIDEFLYEQGFYR